MAIYNDISSLLGNLSKQSLNNTYVNPNSQGLVHSSQEDEKPARSVVGKNSFSGSGLNLELSLSSGKEIDLDIRINQAGGISQLELTSNDELSEKDQEKLQKFLQQLSESVDDLFSGKASGSDLFKFANEKGIADIELSAYQDDGNTKQSLVFDKEGRGSGRKVEAQWSEYDRVNGVEENHDLSLNKQEKRDDQTSIYGQMSYQWLFDQVNTAMSGIDDKAQGKELAAFFNSGIQALFSTAQSGSQLLQELGASSQDAKTFIGRSIKVLADDYKGQEHSGLGYQQRQMNGLPDFTMAFTSERVSRGATNNEYQLSMDISQASDEGRHPYKDESYQTQNRRLRMDYQSAQQKAIYEYTWTRDESIRNVFEGGSLASNHYRINDQIRVSLVDNIDGDRKVRSDESASFQERKDTEY